MAHVTTKTCTISGCDRPHIARGWCSRHYERWRSSGDPLAAPRYDPDLTHFERILSKIEKTDGCWFWTGSVDTHGYGQGWLDGKNQLVHRVMYERYVGPVGDLCVLHACDTPRCVRPSHLHLGTRAENNQEAAERDRRHRPSGTQNPHAKLSEADVRAIRADQRSARIIAAEYGISRANVSMIRTRRTWRHVD